MSELLFKPYSLILEENIFDSIRLYDDDKPSVTSVLKILKDSDSFEMFKKNDMDRYKSMLQAKADLWTQLHKAIELTYSNKKFHSTSTNHSNAWIKFYTKEWHKWNPIHLECQIISEDIWWCVDAVMDINWIRYIVDWKTCWQRTYPELILKYKLQVSKYCKMYNKQYDESVYNWKIVMFSDQWWYQIIDIEDIDTYANMYDQVANKFFEYYNSYKLIN